MDRTRLQPAINEVAAAETAYDTALKRLAAATRLTTQNPRNTAALRERQLASEAVNTSRARVESARVALDSIRLAELLTFQTTDALLGSVPGNQILSLFPVGVEARLEPGRLRVRVWPDAISTSTHDPRLTEPELAATKDYWRAEARSTSEETSRVAWRALCEAIGVTRAAWAAGVLTPTNRGALSPTVAPVFPIVAMQDEAAPFVARAAVLPDRWIAIGLRDDGVRVVEHLGAPIPMDLSVGLDTTPTETATLTNREGEPLQLPPRMRWMTDFATAVQVGMALDIPLAAGVDRIQELFVVGLRLTQTTAQNAAALAGLFTGHRFSRGFAFVPQNTPTNNSVAGGSGLPSRSERIEAAFNLERRPRTFGTGRSSNGTAAARAFGVAGEVFAPMPASGATSAVANEPEGFEPDIAAAMNTALWQVTIGPALEDFLALPESRADVVRNFFRSNVRAAGPVPAVRVGRQPYGVLPVTTLNEFTPAGHEGIDPQLLPLLRAARSWFAMFRQGVVFDGAAQDALLHLGRSTQLFAETTQQNAGFAGQNRWATLAGSLARSTRNLIRDNWRNARITGTVDGTPLPVARPIVDETTAAELSALATALPGAIASRPLHTSVLGRMARQATLLEWSRLAKAACLASIDEASTLNLDRQEARLGSQIFIDVLIKAFAATPTGPLGPVIPGGIIDRIVTRVATPRTVAPGRTVPPALARRRDDDDPFPDEPDEPDGPDGPDRPVPEGDVVVNATELQRIRTLVGSLAQPLSSCPGAVRLASFRQALTQLSTYPAANLESELFGTLDVCNHRIDAWFTSLASRRLETLRAAAPTGVVIGGWGCLQDVRRAAADGSSRAEFIHTPSLDQAAAAAVLRSGARRAQSGGSHHADIDLSSRRVRLARWILEGIRNGRSLNELLGVRFERAVKGTPAEAALGQLRTLFPALSGMGVLDGLALHQTGVPVSSSPEVVRGAAALNEALDAVADALTAEAVFQIVKGNPVGALIDVESVAAGAAPPDLRVLETPPTGIRLTHRLVVALPANATAPGWEARVSPRSRAEPILDAWCGLLLGPANNIVLTVEGGAAPVTVRLSSLRIAAIDVVLGARHGGEELAARVLREASTGPLHNARVREDRAWKDLIGIGDAAARVITRGEPLRPDAFDPPSAMTTAAAEAAGDLPARVADALAELTSVRDALVAGTDPVRTPLRAAAFGVQVPGVLLGSAPSAEQQGALTQAIETRLAGAATGTPRERLRALFGGDLPGVVSFTPRDPEALVTAATTPPASLLNGILDLPRTWLDASARTHSKAAALAEVLLRRDIAGDNGSTRLLIAQSPWTDGDRWIATSFTSASKRLPSGRLSVLILGPAGFPATQPVGGLLIDAWTETIPTSSRDTAMALRFNNASTRAPQTILLAVSPNPAVAWTTTTLVDVLHETLMLARLRVQPPTTFSRGGLMPFAWLGQRPGNAGISFSL